MPQAAKTLVVLGGLSVLLVIVGLWGFNALTEPFPEKSDPPVCVDTAVPAGERVFPSMVTVSVYNASDRNGLAGLTMGLLTDAGFHSGDTGNANGAEVDLATIWTTDPDSPAVALVASWLGPETKIEDRKGRGAGVTVVVGDRFEALVDGQKRVVAQEDATICSPPV